MVNGINSISGQTQSREDMMSKLSALGIPSNIISQGPEAVKNYADQNGITLPAPPTQPQQSAFADILKQGELNGSAQPSKSQPPAELKQQLISLGIPENIISQGPGAVKNYADENGIALPAPPSPPAGFSGNASL